MPASMPTLEQEIETARRRFIAWLEWYRRQNPDADGQPMSITELARRLQVLGRSGVSQLLNPSMKRAPDFPTLVAASLLIRFGYEAILTKDPPPLIPPAGHG